MCACLCLLLRARLKCVEFSCGGKGCREREIEVYVCNLRAILFVKYEANPSFLLYVGVCLCMFWVDVHSSGYLEIVCRFVFHTIVIRVSFIFSPSVRFFSIIIITFCIDFAQFPSKWCTRFICSIGIWLSHFEISCIYFHVLLLLLLHKQRIPDRLTCLDGFLFLCQYEQFITHT